MQHILCTFKDEQTHTEMGEKLYKKRKHKKTSVSRAVLSAEEKQKDREEH